ncbi:IS66 family insertion sequence element accessory protein TnpB [Burkholderia multivorans]|nr:IS66 family insertion sequence element accessory protein TnpB [Burkholderia multivorans]
MITFAETADHHHRNPHLLYERTGFWLLLRRLEQDRFVWPRRHQEVIELTTQQLHWLLDGIDIDALRRHPVRHYQHAS